MCNNLAKFKTKRYLACPGCFIFMFECVSMFAQTQNKTSVLIYIWWVNIIPAVPLPGSCCGSQQRPVLVYRTGERSHDTVMPFVIPCLWSGSPRPCPALAPWVADGAETPNSGLSLWLVQLAVCSPGPGKYVWASCLQHGNWRNLIGEDRRLN